MEDKKVKMKDNIKKFLEEDGLELGFMILSVSVGVVFSVKTYKKGFDAGHDALANAIFAASQKGEGIVLSNTKHGDHIFKATKILKD